MPDRSGTLRLGYLDMHTAAEPVRIVTSGYPPLDGKTIPHRVDGELLRYAARFGLLAHKDDQIDERDRYAIRAGFWREISVRTGVEHPPLDA